MYATNDDKITKTVTKPKWDKARGIVTWLREEIKRGRGDKISYKTLEKQRGFLCHMAMVYENIFPFLKGYHLVLAQHLPRRNDEGWKLTDLQWIGHLESKVEQGDITRAEADVHSEVHFGLDKHTRPQTVRLGE